MGTWPFSSAQGAVEPAIRDELVCWRPIAEIVRNAWPQTQELGLQRASWADRITAQDGRREGIL